MKKPPVFRPGVFQLLSSEELSLVVPKLWAHVARSLWQVATDVLAVQDHTNGPGVTHCWWVSQEVTLVLVEGDVSVEGTENVGIHRS